METLMERMSPPRLSNVRAKGQVFVEIFGRQAPFTAVVLPGRSTALIGAIVLEALDLVADCRTKSVHVRDPKGYISEIGFA